MNPKPHRPAPPEMPGLTTAAKREPMVKLGDLPRVLNCSLRTIERLRSARRFPPPDLMIGTGPRRSPRWKAATIARWIDEGGVR